MTTRLSILCVIVALSLCSATSLAAPPNIVFIYTDDQAPWALGASGDPNAVTPNLDRLVQTGAYLRNAFTTTPVCSPSRAGLFASRYGSEVQITDWINPRTEPEIGLDPKYLLWPEVLQQNGYRTGLFGKWHLGVPDQFHPTKNGFDEFMGFLEGGTKPRNPTLEKNGQRQEMTGFTSDILTDHAIEFIERNREKTFLACLHFRSPHAPYLPVSDEDWEPFSKLDPKLPNPDFPKLNVNQARTKMREYLASVYEVDRNVGKVLEAIDRLQLTSNTVVIFTSDHGYNIGHHGIWHKGNGHWLLTDPPPGTENVPRGQRPNMFDTSLRVPCIVRWPAAIAPATIVDRCVTNLDWYPTILAMAGVDLPSGTTIRGKNFFPLLKKESIEWDDNIYCEYSTHHQSKTQMRVYRTPEWKLIRDLLNPERDELYYLAKDPGESTNLIDSDQPEVRQALEQLQKELDRRMSKS